MLLWLHSCVCIYVFNFIVVRTMNTTFMLITNFKLHSTLLLTIGAMLCKYANSSLLNKNLCPLITNFLFPSSPAPGNHHFTL